MPAEIDENWFAPVEPTSRTVEVDAFCSWSSCRISSRSSARDITGFDLVQLGQHAEVELEEVVDEAERVVGVEERLPDALLVRVGGDHRQLREHADRVELDVLGVVRVGLVLVVGRQRRHCGRQHRHRVRGVRKRGEEALEVLVQQRVVADAVVERGELVGRWEARRR